MRRLKVIDLQTGDQPLYNEDRSIAVIFNGEIYNFRELRQRLEERGHVFRTASDTEVIAHLYEEEGIDCFAHLNGMFAVALHDMKAKRVVLARDPHGMKPLYWMRDSVALRFASELKGLFADPLVSRQPDLSSLLDYLVHWYVPTPRSAFQGVSKLLPGHVLIVDEQTRVDTRPFGYEAGSDQPAPRTFQEASETCLSALEDAVRRQLVADVPVGVFLSGGLDSGIVAALAARLAPQRLCGFTVSFEGHGSYDEGPIARAIAEQAGLEHVLIPFPEDPTELARDALGTFDEPFGDYSSVGMTLLCREARRYATVCLAGDGGDEIFAGYPHYRAPGYARLFRGLPSPARRLITDMVNRLPTSFDRISVDYMAKRFVRGATAPPLEAHLLYKAILFGEERTRLLGPVLRCAGPRDPMEGLRHTLALATRDSPTLLKQLMALDRASFMLDDDLVKVDRTSMAASVEVRLPMLDDIVVAAAAQVPDGFHMRRWATKSLLRDVARKVLPRRAVRLKKKGFTPPMSQWLAGPLRGLVDEELSWERVKAAELVDPAVVGAMIAEHRSRRQDRCRELWTLLSLHEWWGRQGFSESLHVAAS